MPAKSNRTQRSPKERIRLFKLIMQEASEFFKKPAQEVNKAQWRFVSAGRLGTDSLDLFGGYSVVCNSFFPDKNTHVTSETKKMIERMLGQ